MSGIDTESFFNKTFIVLTTIVSYKCLLTAYASYKHIIQFIESAIWNVERLSIGVDGQQSIRRLWH